MTVEIFDPTVSREAKASIAWPPRPTKLDKLRVGLVENTKFNAEKLLLKIAERLRTRHGMTVVHLAHKQSSGHSVEERDIREFKTKADFVIAGVGD
ncbi:MAG: hypothetical protein HY423_11720 [Candidatus Lambdaproteobacteria bacterium]|nr:hypothetical protein [Candidatus Lambdaproteobacteria bacterium]